MTKKKATQPKYPKLSIRVNPWLLERLTKLAEVEKRKPSALARMLIEASLKQKEAA